MADITMCLNQTCKQRLDCYRFNAIANECRQSYADFVPDENGVCEDFWDRKPYGVKQEVDND